MLANKYVETTISASENDNCHCAGTTNGKERLNRKALRRPQKTDIKGADMICWGRCHLPYGITVLPATRHK